jgi:hypothetical protein
VLLAVGAALVREWADGAPPADDADAARAARGRTEAE